MNSVVMSIRGLLSSELWVPTLLVVPVSSGGSGGSGNSEIVGFDWSYQSQIRKWYFVKKMSVMQIDLPQQAATLRPYWARWKCCPHCIWTRGDGGAILKCEMRGQGALPS